MFKFEYLSCDFIVHCLYTVCLSEVNHCRRKYDVSNYNS